MDLSITPSLPPPPGVAPNFVNPYNINPLIDGTLGVCLGITSMLVISRLCTRFLIIKRHGLEDCMYDRLLVTAVRLAKPRRFNPACLGE